MAAYLIFQPYNATTAAIFARSDDGQTCTVSSSAPNASRISDEIGVVGAARPRKIFRGSTVSLEITVGRRFASYKAAEEFEHLHAKKMLAVKGTGILRLKTSLGTEFVYRDAFFDDFSQTNAAGVWQETSYTFSVGDCVSEFALSVLGSRLSINGAEVIISL